MITHILQNKKLNKNLLTFLLTILPACSFTIQGGEGGNPGESYQTLARDFINSLSEPGSALPIEEIIVTNLNKNDTNYYNEQDSNDKNIIMYWIESSQKDLSEKLLKQLHSLKWIKDIKKTFEYAVKSSREDIIEWLIREVENLDEDAIDLNDGDLYRNFFTEAVKNKQSPIIKLFLGYNPENKHYEVIHTKRLKMTKELVFAAIEAKDAGIFERIISYSRDTNNKDKIFDNEKEDLVIEVMKKIILNDLSVFLDKLLKNVKINFDQDPFYALLVDMAKKQNLNKYFKKIMSKATFNQYDSNNNLIVMNSKKMLPVLSAVISHGNKQLFDYLLDPNFIDNKSVNLNKDDNYSLLVQAAAKQDLHYLKNLLAFYNYDHPSYSINLSQKALYGILEKLINDKKNNVLKVFFDTENLHSKFEYFPHLGNDKGAKLVLLSIQQDNKEAFDTLLKYRAPRLSEYQVSLNNENGYQAFIAALKKDDNYWLEQLLGSVKIDSHRLNLAGRSGFEALKLAWKNKERVSKILDYSACSPKDAAIDLNHSEIVNNLMMPLVKKEDQNNGDLLTTLLSYQRNEPSKGISVATKEKLAIQAIKSGDFTATTALIKRGKMQVSNKVEQGNTFFHLAMQTLNRLDEDKDKGQIESVAKIIQFLISRKIDIHITNDNGKKGLDLLTDPNKQKYLPEVLQRNKKSKVDEENKNNNNDDHDDEESNNNNNHDYGESKDNKDDDENKNQSTTLEVKKNKNNEKRNQRDQNEKQLLEEGNDLYNRLLNGRKTVGEIKSILDQYTLPKQLQNAVLFQVASKGQSDISAAEAVSKEENHIIYNLMKRLLTEYPHLVNEKKKNISVIEKCAEYDNSRCISLLVKKEEIKEEDVNKALLKAAYHYHVDAIKELLAYSKINPNYMVDNDQTPLMMLLSKSPHTTKDRERQEKGLRILLGRSDIKVDMPNSNNDTALYFATKYATAAAIRVLINHFQIRISTPLYDHTTILHIIASRIENLITKEKDRNEYSVEDRKELQDMKKLLNEVLIKDLIDPSLKDNSQKKAADLVKNGEIKQMLEEAEKRYNEKNKPKYSENSSNNGEKTLSSWEDCTEYDLVTGDSEFVQQYDEDEMIGILNQYKLDESTQIKALLHAAQQGKERFMKKLIEKYPDILRVARSKGNESVIAKCANFDSIDCLKLLLREASITQKEVQEAFKLAVDNAKSSATIKAFFDYDKFDINYAYEGKKHILWWPSYIADVETIKVLFEHPKIDINFTVEYENHNHQNVRSKPPLIELLTNYDSKEKKRAAVLELFLAHPELDLTVTEDGKSITEIAINFPFSLRKLINSPRVGISNDRRFTKGRSLLHLMVQKIAIWDEGNYMPDRNKKLKELLKEVLDKHEIDPSLEDNEGKKAIDYATSDQIRALLTKAEEEYHNLHQGNNGDPNGNGDDNNRKKIKNAIIAIVVILAVVSCLGAASFFFPSLQSSIKKKSTEEEKKD